MHGLALGLAELCKWDIMITPKHITFVFTNLQGKCFFQLSQFSVLCKCLIFRPQNNQWFVPHIFLSHTHYSQSCSSKFHNFFTSVTLMMNIWPLDYSGSQRNYGLPIDNYQKSTTHQEENQCLLAWVTFLSFLSRPDRIFSQLALSVVPIMSKLYPSHSSTPDISLCVVLFGRFNNDGLVQGDILQRVAPSRRSHHLFLVYHSGNLPHCKTYLSFIMLEEKWKIFQICCVSIECLKTLQLTISYK